jgi:hypothetical protein
MFETVKNELSNFGAVDKKIKHDPNIPFGKNNYSHIFLNIGKRGSSKTTLELNLLKNHYRRFFDKIYLFSSTGKKDPKMDKLIKELEDNNQFFEEVNDEDLVRVMEEIEENNNRLMEEKETPHNLIIFDDVIHSLDKSNRKNSPFNKLITGNRHYKTCIHVISQKYNMLSTLLRSNADLIAFFRSENINEINTLKNDINVNSDLFDDLYKFCTDEPYSFMLINLQTNPKTFYKKFDRILI